MPRSGKRPPRSDWRFPLASPFVVAHRGGSALQPENTLLAFTEAARLPGCRFLELDVHLSADGVPVVIHDRALDRTTGAQGPVAALTAAQLAQVNAAAKFTHLDGSPAPRCPVPTLEEVLLALPSCLFSVDVKAEADGAETAVIATIRRAGMSQRVILGSGAPRTHARIRNAAPDIPTFFPWPAVLGFWLAAHLGLGRWYRPRDHSLQVPERAGSGRLSLPIVTRAFLRLARRLGIPVTVWTVNEEADMRRLLRLGVDGLMTDRPDVALRVIREFLERDDIARQTG